MRPLGECSGVKVYAKLLAKPPTSGPLHARFTRANRVGLTAEFIEMQVGDSTTIFTQKSPRPFLPLPKLVSQSDEDRTRPIVEQLYRLEEALNILESPLSIPPVVVFHGDPFPTREEQAQLTNEPFRRVLPSKVSLDDTGFILTGTGATFADDCLDWDMLHEMGHVYWFSPSCSPDQQEAFRDAVTDEAGRVACSPTEYGSTSVEECYAEWFAHFASETLVSAGRSDLAPKSRPPHQDDACMTRERFAALSGLVLPTTYPSPTSA